MALTKFKLVNTEGVRALHFAGDTIPLDKIDDQLAERLYGKTHVLERVQDVPAAPAPLALEAGAPAAEPTAATDGEQLAPPTTGRRRG